MGAVSVVAITGVAAGFDFAPAVDIPIGDLLAVLDAWGPCKG